MAQRLVDDLDPTLFAERTITFCLDGTFYDIDLATENITRLEGALQPFIDAGRARTAVRPPSRARVNGAPLNVTRSHKTAPGRAEQLAAIRDWARQQGFEVSERGRIPEAIQDAFEKSHTPAGKTPQFSSPV